MNLFKKFMCIVLLNSLCIYASYAQGGYANFTYNIAMPLGATAGYINKTSFRGASAEVGIALNENIALGLSGSWHVFYKNSGYTTVELSSNSALSGKEYRYINALPLMAIGRYLFNSESKITPFAGLGIGTAYVEQRTDIGSVPFGNNGWHFALAPEAGAVVKAGYRTNIFTNLRFTNAFKRGSIENVSFTSLNLGITYSY